MTPSQVIQLHALKLKATVEGNSPAFLDQILANPMNQDDVKKEFRNVCALIPVPLFEELESLSNLLDLSKREIVNLALVDFFKKAHEIVNEINPFEFQEFIEQQQKKGAK